MGSVIKSLFGLTRSSTLVSFAVGLLILWLLFRLISRQRDPRSEISQALREANVPDSFIDILIAQAIHETNGFKSRIFRNNNNAFGMKVPRVRDTLAIDPKGDLVAIEGFALYNSVGDSARDMLLWLEDFNLKPNFTDPVKYVTTLKDKGYFEDSVSNYLGGVLNGLSKIKIERS